MQCDQQYGDGSQEAIDANLPVSQAIPNAIAKCRKVPGRGTEQGGAGAVERKGNKQ